MHQLRRLLKYAKKDWPYFTLATAATLVITGLNLWAPLIIRDVLGVLRTETGAAAWHHISRLGLVLLAIYLLRTFCQFIARYYSHVGGWNLVARMRAITYDHLQKLSLRYYQDKQTGQLMSRIVYDTANLENLSAHALPDLLSNIVLFAGVTIVVFTLNPRGAD